MDDTKELDKWLSVSEASELSGYGMDWLRELAKNGDVESVKKGHMVLINRQSLERYVKDKKTQFN